MFNKKVTDVLSQINSITESVILKYPQTVAISDSGDMLMLVDISELDQDEFHDIGLKDSLSKFLRIFSLFPEDREVDITANTVNISSGDQSTMFITQNIALMDAYEKDPEQFAKTSAAPSVASFVLTTDDIKNIKTASGVFDDLTEVLFTSQDGDLKLSLAATNRFNAKSNTFSINKSCNTTKEFEIKVPVKNFTKIPTSDYQFDIKYNSARNQYRIIMTNKTLSGFQIIMALKAD